MAGIADMVGEIRRLQEENRMLKQEVSRYRVKGALNKRQFDYMLCGRKNGTDFIKVIYDSYEADGWVEIARINLSKSEWVRDRFSTKDIFDELKTQ